MIKRFSNIELCRIFSILLVLLVHSAFASNGYPKELNKTTLWLITLESLSIIGVNVFILISGYFSIKLKPKTIYTILITVAFYFLLLTGLSFLCGKGEHFQIKNLLFVSNSHYFIIDYLGLALLSPILNQFAENTSKKHFTTVLLALIIYQIYFTFISGATKTEFDYGYSLMSFSIIYLIARYIKLYDVPDIIKKYSGLMYIICTLTLMLASVLLIKLEHLGAIGLVYAYNNPVVIASSVFFFLFFEKMNIRNNKYINHIARSTLGILLFHASTPAHTTVWYFMKTKFMYLADNIDLVNALYWIGWTVAIAMIAVVIDQLRLFIIDRIYRTPK